MVMKNLQNPLISVAIVTWNRRQYVLRAIESVFKQPYRPIEVVVVDSASSDGTVEAIEEAYPEVRVIRLHRNMGCPEGRNVALANCAGEIIFSLDDDAWLIPTTLNLCVERFRQEPSLGLIACQILAPEEEKGEEKNPKNTKEHYTYLFTGCAFAVRKEVLGKTGYFPSDFFRQAEEGDLALRILEAGYSILCYPRAVIYHERVPINRNNKLFMFYGCRNELYTVIRRYPLFLVPVGVFWKVLVWNWAGVKKLALHFTLGACITTAFKLPRLLLQREPVSLKTIKKIMTLRGKFRKI
ncbi:glycosyltransferase family 2 protein [Thermodesulfovibrionales bacterium]|nr:glycosyltransferase family 2 protein [Thermodesulfovibrionales bacterium]